MVDDSSADVVAAPSKGKGMIFAAVGVIAVLGLGGYAVVKFGGSAAAATHRRTSRASRRPRRARS